MNQSDPPPYVSSHRYVIVDRSDFKDSNIQTDPSPNQMQIIDNHIVELKHRLECELRDIVHQIDKEMEALENRYIRDKSEIVCHRQRVVVDRLFQFQSFLVHTLAQRSKDMCDSTDIFIQDGWLWRMLNSVWTMLF